MTDMSLEILINQHAGLFIVLLAVAITVCVCFLAVQWRKARQAESALVIEEAILSRQTPISETEMKWIMQAAHSSELWRRTAPVQESTTSRLLSKLILVLSLLVCVFFLFLVTLPRHTITTEVYHHYQDPSQNMNPNAKPFLTESTTVEYSSITIPTTTGSVASQTTTTGSVLSQMQTTSNVTSQTPTTGSVTSQTTTAGNVASPSFKKTSAARWKEMVVSSRCQFNYDWFRLDASNHPSRFSNIKTLTNEPGLRIDAIASDCL
jgi:hypothetical protein